MVSFFCNTIFCRVAQLLLFELRSAIIFISKGPKSSLYLKACNVREQVAVHIFYTILSIQRKEKIKTNYCILIWRKAWICKSFCTSASVQKLTTYWICCRYQAARRDNHWCSVFFSKQLIFCQGCTHKFFTGKQT